MAKISSKWLFLLLAVIVLAKVDGQRGQGGSEFPPRGGGHGGGGSEFPPRGGGGRGGSEFPPRGGGHGGGGSEFPPRGGGGRGYPQEGYGGDSRRFILTDIKRVVATDAGGMRVVRGVGGKFEESPMHIGFITMEPNSMFIPQYLDSSIILFVDIGEARIGSIYNDKLVEKDLKTGDIYRIQAGSAFYLVNNAGGQRLHIITSIDTAESSDFSPFQTFYIGGGTNPKSVLAGFDRQTLATALNVSYDVVDELFSSRQQGPIVFLNPDSESQDEPSMWKRFLEQGTQDRKTQMKKFVNVRQKSNEEGEKASTWSLTKVFNGIFGKNVVNKDESLDSYNIFNRKADFKNDYGWSIQVTGDDYDPLKLSDFAIYLVNLTAGSMMAPHINPRAIEYGIVLTGSGTIQIVYPNGTLAMNAEVNAGDVFWIPRYFAFCQVASRSGPFVFVGFSTSALDNKPQFLVGDGSLLQIMMGKEFATAFDLPEDKMTKIVNAQKESTILPSPTAAPGGGSEEIPGDESGDQSKGGGSEEIVPGDESTDQSKEKEGGDQSKKGGDRGGSSFRGHVIGNGVGVV